MIQSFINLLIQAQETTTEVAGALAENGGEEVANNPQGGSWTTWVFLLAMIAIFYFLMIRPQQKKQKEIKKAREAMKVGDHVITAGGIMGKITGVKDNCFVISVDSNVTLKVDKGSVYPGGTPSEEIAAEKK